MTGQGGGTTVPPPWKLLPGRDGGAAAERGAWDLLFAPRYALHPQVRGYADLIFGYSAAGRRLPDLVDSA